jgi:hypothetical protein
MPPCEYCNEPADYRCSWPSNAGSFRNTIDLCELDAKILAESATTRDFRIVCRIEHE